MARGPGFIFLYHPALGPLWDVIAQKIRGGALAPGAELVLEVGLSPLTPFLQSHSACPSLGEWPTPTCRMRL